MHKVTVLDKKGALDCPIRDVINRIGDKWSLLILVVLSEQPTRFNELKRTIGDISQKVLTKVLKELEQEGYITRTAYDESPPKVVYDLTEMGISVLTPVGHLIDWAEKNHAMIKGNRSKTD
ncbi:helix-turn-helix transcriptional regulator [Colwellia demingiae]|uniref:Helix-turn-helix transcriptional regulator n=1 Tax=Colwellia demingiae TaxID=89401 RepID=A0A5C6Q8J6_9GAMM|nr:helix-turn-helix domain-containing protein [Colwellia demingiae]TWX65246.1 helix-turn-helix transcriptional regulator [Colwellia demingiae]